jgi:hypothetical protein
MLETAGWWDGMTGTGDQTLRLHFSAFRCKCKLVPPLDWSSSHCAGRGPYTVDLVLVEFKALVFPVAQTPREASRLPCVLGSCRKRSGGGRGPWRKRRGRDDGLGQMLTNIRVRT